MRQKPTKEQEDAGKFISDTLHNCHEELDNLYEDLFPDGLPISGIGGAIENKLRKVMKAMRENLAGIREYFNDN